MENEESSLNDSEMNILVDGIMMALNGDVGEFVSEDYDDYIIKIENSE